MVLTSDKFGLAEFKRQIFVVQVDSATTLEDLLKVSYWAHVAAKLHVGDRIEVLSEDYTEFTELQVLDCDRNWARVGVLRSVKMGKRQETSKDKTEDFQGKEHYVDWGGQQQKARVIRKEDKVVIKDGFASKNDAKEYMMKLEADLVD